VFRWNSEEQLRVRGSAMKGRSGRAGECECVEPVTDDGKKILLRCEHDTIMLSQMNTRVLARRLAVTLASKIVKK